MTDSIMKNNCILLRNKLIKSIFSLVSILLLWELIAWIIGDEYFMPRVESTFSAMTEIIFSKSFFKVVFKAIYRVLSGLFWGIIIGVALASICHKSEIVNAIISPIISIMKATPVASIIVLLWIHLTYAQFAVFVVMLMVIPIIWQNVYDGYKEIDKSLVEVADIFELSLITRIKVLIIPTVLTYLLPAIITSVGMAWKAEIAAEIMTGKNIGQLIYDFKNVSLDTTSIFAWTAIIVILSVIFEKSAKYLLGRLMNELKN